MRALLLIACVATAFAKFSYEGYYSIAIPSVTSDDASIVKSLADTDDRLQQVMLMNDHLVSGMEAHLIVSPGRAQDVMDTLDQFDIPYEVLSTNYQSWIDEVDARNEEAKKEWLEKQKNSGYTVAPSAYLTNAEMNDWMQMMADTYSIVTVSNIGTTEQGNSIYQLNIDGTGNPSAKHVYVNGGIHCREWISHATMVYIAHELAASTDALFTRMRETYVWHIPPNINPDGYIYTHQSTRLWRKNRAFISGSSCVGIDLNRNWDYLWGGPGASPSPCDETYRGPSANSEPEVRSVQGQIQAIGASNIILYMDVHSYSQLWLVPWGGTTTKPNDYTQLKAGGDAAAAAIRAVNGLNFAVGTPPDLLYVASGGAFDWAKGTAGVKYAYSPELRPATAGQGGFVIDPSNIYPSGREIWAGLAANVDYAAANP